MNHSPTYCPKCAAENIVATLQGPTCRHQEKHGAQWFPAGWDRMQEHERVAWIQANSTTKT